MVGKKECKFAYVGVDQTLRRPLNLQAGLGFAPFAALLLQNFDAPLMRLAQGDGRGGQNFYVFSSGYWLRRSERFLRTPKVCLAFPCGEGGPFAREWWMRFLFFVQKDQPSRVGLFISNSPSRNSAVCRRPHGSAPPSTKGCRRKSTRPREGWAKALPPCCRFPAQGVQIFYRVTAVRTRAEVTPLSKT